MAEHFHSGEARKPPWLVRRLPTGPDAEQVRTLIDRGRLHTVCQEAHCPNIYECFSRHTATFLILGSRCTRNCRFCAVLHGLQGPPDREEPVRVAEAVADMGLDFVVVTSVTRDDLPDGGARQFAETIAHIRKRRPKTRVEVLIPDFNGNWEALATVMTAGPDVLNHNIDTVARLYPVVRPQAVYERSLALLRKARDLAPDILTKSGIMLGLGEEPDEVEQALLDLRHVGCEILTLGQYLRPSEEHLPVHRYVSPEEFDDWRDRARPMGFKEVASGPFVRSSYHAGDAYRAAQG